MVNCLEYRWALRQSEVSERPFVKSGKLGMHTQYGDVYVKQIGADLDSGMPLLSWYYENGALYREAKV